jgi:hypothetical protein
MKNVIKTILLAATLAPFCSFAAMLTHMTGGQFVENGVSISYPCSAGGEPLVIYGTPIQNKTPISSKTTLYPLYIKEGYQADPLVVAEAAQSNAKSPLYLITQSTNPGTAYHYVQFNLQRVDNSLFYVNTVNFATINTNDKDKFVSVASVTGDNDVMLYQSQFPVQNHSYDQDWGVMIFSSLKTISGKQYSWNQNTPWINAKSVVKYNFTTVASDSIPNFYAGFGFWICGSNQPVKSNMPLPKVVDKIYIDQIRQTK